MHVLQVRFASGNKKTKKHANSPLVADHVRKAGPGHFPQKNPQIIKRYIYVLGVDFFIAFCSTRPPQNT